MLQNERFSTKIKHNPQQRSLSQLDSISYKILFNIDCVWLKSEKTSSTSTITSTRIFSWRTIELMDFYRQSTFISFHSLRPPPLRFHTIPFQAGCLFSKLQKSIFKQNDTDFLFFFNNRLHVNTIYVLKDEHHLLFVLPIGNFFHSFSLLQFFAYNAIEMVE